LTIALTGVFNLYMAVNTTEKLELKFFLNDAEVNMVRKERALQWGSIEIIKEAGKVVRIVTHESELI